MRYLIAHAEWRPEREASLNNLLEQLPHHRDGGATVWPDVEVIRSEGPEHAAIWSRRIWERAGANRLDHTCILNDDVVLQPDFEGIAARAIEAVPDECISLHCTNPLAANVPGAWARCYHYTGPAVILPPGAAADLLSFVYSLPWSMLSRMNEDNIANEWAWSKQRPFWYLLPAPVTHDTSVPSTLGYDHHPNRTPTVLGPERDPEVKDRDAVPFIELDWCTTRGLAYRRAVIQAGRKLCTFCMGREGAVGNVRDMVCLPCLEELGKTVMRAKR